MAESEKSYDTKLSKDDETSFQTWATEAGRVGDLTDYDLRGWWKKNGKQDARGHMTDEFKKPNHPTFSADSKYSDKDNPGGKWSGSEAKGWTFTPSEANLKNMSAEKLKAYFQEREPDAKLILPEAEESSRSDRWYGDTMSPAAQ